MAQIIPIVIFFVALAVLNKIAYGESTNHQRVAWWLLGSAFLVACMVAVGGLTRLTLSGLSMPEWRPLTGWLPPLSQKQWNLAFEAYQSVPQYRLINMHMHLQDFKSIYMWEYVHRLLGRITVLFFMLPAIYFTVTRQLPKQMILPLTSLFILLPVQGIIGWYMVSSGLSGDVDRVNASRLALHLLTAFLIYALLFTSSLRLINNPSQNKSASHPRASWIKFSLALLIGLLLMQIPLGALIAGGQMHLIFLHRGLGVFLLIFTIHISYNIHRTYGNPHVWLPLLMGSAMQVALGIYALKGGGLISNFLHQVGGLIFFTCALYCASMIFFNDKTTEKGKTEAKCI